MALSDTVLDLSDLVEDQELPLDPTGVLAGLGGVLGPLACEGLMLCRPDGRLIATASVAEGWNRPALESLCRRLAQGGCVSPGGIGVLPAAGSQRLGVAIPLEMPEERGFLGMVLQPGPDWQEHLGVVRPALVACARAA